MKKSTSTFMLNTSLSVDRINWYFVSSLHGSHSKGKQTAFNISQWEEDMMDLNCLSHLKCLHVHSDMVSTSSHFDSFITEMEVSSHFEHLKLEIL